MGFSAGTKVGAYEILGLLGKGGWTAAGVLGIE